MILHSFFRPRLSWILDRIILRQNHEDLDDEGSMALGKKGVSNPFSCVRKYMKSTSESLSHPETSNGKAAGGNCVVARRSGEQPEADLRSQIQVNPIRFTTTASLREAGEACRMSGNRFLPHPSFTGEKRAVVDGWGENAGKVSCGRVEICPGRNPRERSRAEVRASIVAMKRGNARGVRGGRKVERQKP
jgi:hypothetical protein